MIENVINKEQIDRFTEIFDYIFQGNQFAIDLCLDVVTTFHVWDDLYDDEEIHKHQINRAFRHLIDDIPMNPVMLNNATILYPILFNVYTQWHAANTMEEQKEDQLIDKSYMLRAGIYQFFVMVAKCLHGNDWAENISTLVFNSYSEKLEDLKKEILNA